MSEFKTRPPTPSTIVDEMLETFCVECIRSEILRRWFSTDYLPEIDTVARERNAVEGRCAGCNRDRQVVLQASERATALLRQPPDF